jgi:hypothetical protein
MKKLFAVLIVALVPFGLAACGDDDDGPSKETYIKEADAICARSDRETDEIFNNAFEDPADPQPEEAQEALKAALPVVKEDLEELKALEKPKDDEDEIDAIWTAIDEGIATLEEASADPATSLTALTSEPFAAGEKLAGDYGMDDCGPDEE